MSGQPVQDKAERDRLIEEAAREFPEHSLEPEEVEYDDREYHEDNSGDYDGYEGKPGAEEFDKDGNPSNERDPDAAQFERYYGEPPTPAVDREPGE